MIEAGSGTLRKPEDEQLDSSLGNSTSPTSSSARPASKSTKEDKKRKQGFSEAKTMNLDSAKVKQTILNKAHPSGRSIGGGVKPADLDQHGGVDAARMQAQLVPGETELLPGVQAPRECLSPRRQIGKVGAADRLLADGQGDQPDPNARDHPWRS